ncbi:hypothetical protein N7450_010007 [Penicillium hetheringtonii]|uniref:Sec20 C-terminal domain-containing protein n=1 Tax=Penicillium hetheringtonii TaxID=911720 RepID=A0AAD6GNY4_9EURO|nr:hypothetical protein N7450_010007 [Penicillium hetheringtonii]
MSSVTALQTRLKELSNTLGQIQPLLDRLRNFTTAIGQGDEARLELGAEIRAQLKEAEAEFELLREEVNALKSDSNRWKKSATDADKETEKERVIFMAGRLEDDLKRLPGEFRHAQLQAKRNAEAAQRKERELLFSRPQSPPTNQRQSTDKFTQDDLVRNASNDVTSALRRTHNLMKTELSRSQFAQETLEQSSAAINSLSESYSSLDTLISSSRSLANSLLRSQKSDTWYLETAFYILLGTIAWLLFRRILWGPTWWLLWLPLKFAWKFVFTILGAVGLSRGSAEVSASSVASDISATIQHTATAVTGGTVPSGVPDADGHGAQQDEEDRVIDKIGQMVENGQKEDPSVKPISPEERAWAEQQPRNTKKRMWEEDVRDEL